MEEKEKTVMALGASRGLGAAVIRRLQGNCDVVPISRTAEKFKADFSKPEEQTKVLKLVDEINPNKIFYFAGGGPYGKFADKEWKDHQWSLEVNFLFPARLLHYVIKENKIKQIVFVGSLIAEDQAHPLGASYGAGKSALKALIQTIRSETSIDIRLFSPGFMDTAMLPKNAYPRREGFNLLSPDFVAEKFYEWVNNKSTDWYLGVPNE
jgi:short-subunit dehydrogenase